MGSVYKGGGVDDMASFPQNDKIVFGTVAERDVRVAQVNAVVAGGTRTQSSWVG